MPFSSFLLFVGVAMCITAFPVLARVSIKDRKVVEKWRRIEVERERRGEGERLEQLIRNEILTEEDMTNSDLGVLALSSAAINDVMYVREYSLRNLH